MTDRLKGKVAIITGGSTGIGEGIAKIFKSEGAKITICGRRKELLDKVVDKIGIDDVLALQCDVSKTDQVKDLIEKTVKRFGKLNILVNNAGKNVGRKFTLEEATEEEWCQYMDTNAKGSWLTSKYSIPEMRKTGGGSIIMITSISAVIGHENSGVYNSTKAAQEGLVRSMAMDFRKENIRVNAIRPGWVEVDSLKKEREKIMDYIELIHPMGRLGQPEDIAWAAVYLASDESTWVTGARFDIDGGYLAK